MHLFRSLLILLVLSGCSHDLAEIPRVDAGDESDADAADATLSRQDGAVTDAPNADSSGADASADASVSPQQGFIVELAATASINGVASEGQDLILAGKSGDHSLVVRVDSTGPGGSDSSWANRYRHPESPTELLGAAADSSQVVAVGTLTTSDPKGRSNGWILFLDGEGESNEGYEVEMESSLRLHAVALSSSMYVAVGTHQSEPAQGVIVAGDLARLSPPKIVRVNAGANIELQTVVAGGSDSTFYFGGSMGEHGLVARMDLELSDAPIIQVWSQRLLSGLTSADALALRSDPASLLASGPGGSFFAFETADGKPAGARGSLFSHVHSIAADGPNQWVNGVTGDFPRAGERNNVGRISYSAWEGGNLMALRTALALAGDTWFQVLGSTTSDRVFHVLPVDGGCGARSERDSSAMEEFPTLDSTITLTLTESFASDPIPVETESAGVDWRPCSGE